MGLLINLIFFIQACQSLPLDYTIGTSGMLAVEISSATEKLSDKLWHMDESVTMNKNDEKTTQSAGRLDKVPMFVHLTEDQVNQMQAEINANSKFTQNVYVNLNSACPVKSITQLVTFLIFIFM